MKILKYLLLFLFIIAATIGFIAYNAPSYLMSKQVANYTIQAVDPNSPWEVESANFKINWFSAQQIQNLVLRHKHNNLKFAADNVEVSLSLYQLINFAYSNVTTLLKPKSKQAFQLGPFPELTLKMTEGKVYTQEHLEKGTFFYAKQMQLDIQNPSNNEHLIDFNALFEGAYQGQKGQASISAQWQSPTSIFELFTSWSKVGVSKDSSLLVNINVQDFPIQFIRSLERNFKEYKNNKQVNRAFIKTLGDTLNANIELKLLNANPYLHTVIDSEYVGIDLKATIDDANQLVFEPSQSFVSIPWHILNASINDPDLYYIHPETRTKAFLNINKVVLPWSQGSALLANSFIDIDLKTQPANLTLNNKKNLKLSQGQLAIRKDKSDTQITIDSLFEAAYSDTDTLYHKGQTWIPTQDALKLEWDHDINGSIGLFLKDFLSIDTDNNRIAVQSKGVIDSNQSQGSAILKLPFIHIEKLNWLYDESQIDIKAPKISLDIPQKYIHNIQGSTLYAPEGLNATAEINKLTYNFNTGQGQIDIQGQTEKKLYSSSNKEHALNPSQFKIYSSNSKQLLFESRLNIDSLILSSTNIEGKIDLQSYKDHTGQLILAIESKEGQAQIDSRFNQDLVNFEAQATYKPSYDQLNHLIQCTTGQCISFSQPPELSINIFNGSLSLDKGYDSIIAQLTISDFELNQGSNRYEVYSTNGRLELSDQNLKYYLKGSHGKQAHPIDIRGNLNLSDIEGKGSFFKANSSFSEDLYSLLPNDSFYKILGKKGDLLIDINSSNKPELIAELSLQAKTNTIDLEVESGLTNNWDITNIHSNHSLIAKALIEPKDMTQWLKNENLIFNSPVNVHIQSEKFFIPLDTKRWDQAICKLYLKTKPIALNFKDSSQLNINETFGEVVLNTFYNPAYINWSLQGQHQDNTFDVSLKSQINNLTTKNTKLLWSDLKMNSTVAINDLPTSIMTQLMTNTDKKNILKELFGNSINGDILQTASKGIIEAYAKLESDNLTANIPLIIDYPTVTLKDPIQAQALVNSSLGRSFMKAYAPDINGEFAFENPISFQIQKDAFNYDLTNKQSLSIKKGAITVGKGSISNNKLLNSTFNLLDQVFDDYNERDESHKLWVTPIYFSINEGKLSLKRFDVLIDSEMPIASWGTYDIGKDRLSFKFGIEGEYLALKLGKSPQTLKKKGYVPITYKGNLSDARLDTRQLKKAVTVLVGTRTLVGDSLIRNIINQVVSLPFMKDIPKPTTKPLPWLRDTQYQKRRDQLKARAVGLSDSSSDNSNDSKKEEKKKKFDVLDLLKKIK